MAHHVIGDDRVCLGGRVERAGGERREGRLENVERRDAFAMRIRGEERIVRIVDQPPAMRVGQRTGRRRSICRIPP